MCGGDSHQQTSTTPIRYKVGTIMYGQKHREHYVSSFYLVVSDKVAQEGYFECVSK